MLLPPQSAAASPPLRGLIAGCKMTLTHTTSCLPLSSFKASGKKMAAEMFWHMNVSRQLSALHHPSLSELTESWLVWTRHAECVQVAALQQAGLVSGSGGAAVEVCPSYGYSAGQVGQVGRLAGSSWRIMSGVSCWSSEITACRKQEAGGRSSCFITSWWNPEWNRVYNIFL